MLAKDLTFGVEIECYLPRGQRTKFETGSYHRGNQIKDAPRGWNAQRDGSLNNVPNGYFPAEIVSPVLKGVGGHEANGLIDLWYMVEYMQKSGAIFNSQCGLHVHVGSGHLGDKQLFRLAKLFRQHEGAFLAVSGENVTDRIGNGYCKLSMDWTSLPWGNRYRSLNVINSHNTVEFRLFSPSSSMAHIVTATYMCVALVAKISQMTDAELDRLTPYPRPYTYTQFANNFIEEFFGQPDLSIDPESHTKEVEAILLDQATKADAVNTSNYYQYSVRLRYNTTLS